ncbi:MAG: hypothetical protein GY827_11605 [Cytophagales bacterium]|nr:hypothetical protein [Cytophagales bacterium]
MNRLIMILWGVFLPFFCIAQTTEEEFALYQEISLGINFNTNGGVLGGLSLRYAYPKNDKTFHLYHLEVVNVKHKKEAQFASAITGNSFILEKLNYLLSVRPSYGQEFILFRRYPESGVRLSAVLAGGPTFGVIKPYYIEYQNSGVVEIVPYNPNIHNVGNIRSNASFLYGWGDLSLQMGAHLKAGLFFELSQERGSVSGVEFGTVLEGFLQNVPIYNTTENKRLYSSVYITLHYGLQK